MKYLFLKQNNIVAELRRVTESQTPSYEGGPDAYVYQFLNSAADAEVLLLSYHRTKPFRNEIERYRNNDAFSYYWGSAEQYSRFVFFPKLRLLTRRIYISARIFFDIVKFRPTRMVCWAASFPLWAAFIASKVVKARFIVSRHNSIRTGTGVSYRLLVERLDNAIMRNADAIICNGPFLRAQLLGIGVSSNRIFEFNWSFRHMMPEKHRLRSRQAHFNQTKVVLFVGRVERSKGVLDLLEAMKDLLIREETLRLVFVGDGGVVEDLKSKAEQYRLDRRVRCLGRIEHHELAEIISGSYVLVTPTQSWFNEGRCMAALEGMVMGVPVVAPNWGPFPFTVVDGVNGMLYEKDSIEALRSSLTRIIYDEKLRAGLAEGAASTGKRIVSNGKSYGEALKESFVSIASENKSERKKFTKSAR
jgi:glycosyltransferase involved in cell wall biosynthesis